MTHETPPELFESLECYRIINICEVDLLVNEATSQRERVHAETEHSRRAAKAARTAAVFHLTVEAMREPSITSCVHDPFLIVL